MTLVITNSGSFAISIETLFVFFKSKSVISDIKSGLPMACFSALFGWMRGFYIIIGHELPPNKLSLISALRKVGSLQH